MEPRQSAADGLHGDVDVRERDEFVNGYVPGAIFIPRGFLELRIEQYQPDRDAPIVVYCASGVRSVLAARDLQELGYNNVSSLRGGFNGWKNNGFRWETPVAGEMPDPTARAAVLADHDGELDSYGVELEVANLEATPEQADATIEVSDETGRTVTLEPRRQRGCLPEGTVFWRLGDRAAQEATTLSGGTFRYRVTVTLDGTEHVATATWPDEEIPDYGPSVELEFSPPLPAMTR